VLNTKKLGNQDTKLIKEMDSKQYLHSNGISILVTNWSESITATETKPNTSHQIQICFSNEG